MSKPYLRNFLIFSKHLFVDVVNLKIFISINMLSYFLQTVTHLYAIHIYLCEVFTLISNMVFSNNSIICFHDAIWSTLFNHLCTWMIKLTLFMSHSILFITSLHWYLHWYSLSISSFKILCVFSNMDLLYNSLHTIHVLFMNQLRSSCNTHYF